MVNIFVEVYEIPAINELWTGQAVLSHLTLKSDLDLEPSQMVLVHCTANYGNAHAYQV